MNFSHVCMAAVLGGVTLFTLMLILWHRKDSPLRPLVNRAAAALFAVSTPLLVASPIDIVPDVIPVLGWLDDVVYLISGYYAARYALTGGQSKAAVKPAVGPGPKGRAV